MSLKTFAATALAILALAAAAACVVADEPASSGGRLLDAAKTFFRNPLNRGQKPPQRDEAQQATWNQPQANVAAGESAGKPDKTTSRPASPPSRAARKPARTISEYMAQERP